VVVVVVEEVGQQIVEVVEHLGKDLLEAHPKIQTEHHMVVQVEEVQEQ